MLGRIENLGKGEVPTNRRMNKEIPLFLVFHRGSILKESCAPTREEIKKTWDCPLQVKESMKHGKKRGLTHLPQKDSKAYHQPNRLRKELFSGNCLAIPIESR